MSCILFLLSRKRIGKKKKKSTHNLVFIFSKKKKSKLFLLLLLFLGNTFKSLLQQVHERFGIQTFNGQLSSFDMVDVLHHVPNSKTTARGLTVSPRQPSIDNCVIVFLEERLGRLDQRDFFVRDRRPHQAPREGSDVRIAVTSEEFDGLVPILWFLANNTFLRDGDLIGGEDDGALLSEFFETAKLTNQLFAFSARDVLHHLAWVFVADLLLVDVGGNEFDVEIGREVRHEMLVEDFTAELGLRAKVKNRFCCGHF